MQVFKLSCQAHGVELYVKSNCVSCVRRKAVEASPASEVLIWRDPSKSSLEVVESLPKEVSFKKGCVYRKIISEIA